MGRVDQRKPRATFDNSEGRAAELRGLAGFPLLGFWVTRHGGQVGWAGRDERCDRGSSLGSRAAWRGGHTM
jgi:hypothetical protein